MEQDGGFQLMALMGYSLSCTFQFRAVLLRQENRAEKRLA